MTYIDKLRTKREAATIDKADLFDFYHDHWDEVIERLQELEEQLAVAEEPSFEHLVRSDR